MISVIGKWLFVAVFAIVGALVSGGEAYAADGSVVKCPTFDFDFNMATSTELQQLSGLGPAMATNVINARPFSSIDDLVGVSGIGAATLTSFKNQCNQPTNVTLYYWTDDTSTIAVANYYDEQICDLVPAMRDGYDFVNWSFVQGSSANVATNCITVAAAEMQNAAFANNHTFYATWQAAQYIVTFDSLGGGVLPDETVIFGEMYGALPTPVRSGYDFDGWCLDAALTVPITADTSVNTLDDHTLYARWIETVVTPEPNISNDLSTIPNLSTVDNASFFQDNIDTMIFGITPPSSGLKPGSSVSVATPADFMYTSSQLNKFWANLFVLSSVLILISLYYRNIVQYIHERDRG